MSLASYLFVSGAVYKFSYLLTYFLIQRVTCTRMYKSTRILWNESSRIFECVRIRNRPALERADALYTSRPSNESRNCKATQSVPHGAISPLRPLPPLSSHPGARVTSLLRLWRHSRTLCHRVVTRQLAGGFSRVGTHVTSRANTPSLIHATNAVTSRVLLTCSNNRPPHTEIGTHLQPSDWIPRL